MAQCASLAGRLSHKVSLIKARRRLNLRPANLCDCALLLRNFGRLVGRNATSTRLKGLPLRSKSDDLDIANAETVYAKREIAFMSIL
jgi:hypothetical protein